MPVIFQKYAGAVAATLAASRRPNDSFLVFTTTMKTKSIAGFIILTVGLCGLTGCASIVSGGPARVAVKSQPSGARIRVFDANGVVVTNATSPTVLRLNRGRGYFKSASYRIELSLDGYRPANVSIVGSVNGWYWGNILLGGLIGMVVVDPLTGSMYTLAPKEVDLALDATHAQVTRKDGGLVVVLRQDLPADLQQSLRPLGPG